MKSPLKLRHRAQRSCGRQIPRLGRVVPCAVPALFLLNSCTGESAGGPPELQFRDSAGIRIVEYSSIPRNLESWTVSPEPHLSIGSIEGEGPDVFGRVQSVVQRADGVIVVADGLSLQLKAFEPSGRHLWTAGSKGEGPGEFRSLSRISLLAGDSVIAIDQAGRRGVVFGPDGTFARGWRLASPPEGYAGLWALGATERGDVVAFAASVQAPPPEGKYRLPFLLLYYDQAGALRATAGQLPSGDYALIAGPSQTYTSMALPLGRRTETSVRGEDIAITTQDRFEVLRYDSDGTLRQILRVLREPLGVDAAVRNRLEESEVQRIEGMLPETLPAVGRIHMDAEGRLWVEEYVPPYEERQPVWWVFDKDGRAIAKASVPFDSSVQQIDSDHLLVVAVDSFGVSYVQGHRIMRDGIAAN